MGLVQEAQAGGEFSAPGTLNVTFASNITPGNGIIIGTTTLGTASPSISGSSDSFALAVATPSAGEASIFYVSSSVGNYNTISITNPFGSVIIAYAYEVQGNITLDQTAFIDSASSPWTAGPTSPTAAAGEIFVGYGQEGYTGASNSLTGPGAPWINEPVIDLNPVVNNASISSYQFVTTSSSPSYTLSDPNVAPNDGYAVLATFRLSISLTSAQLTTSAHPLVVQIPGTLALPTAKTTISAGAVTFVRRLLVAVSSKAGTDDYGNSFTTAITGSSTPFQPGMLPAVAETAHSMPAMSASWAPGAGGQAKYMIDSAGNLLIAFILKTIGTKTDGTTIWASGSFPSGYQVPVAKAIPAVLTMTVSETMAGAALPATLIFATNGAVTIRGFANVAGTISQVDCHHVIPLAI